MPVKKKYNYPKALPLLKFFWLSEAIRKNPIPFHNTFFSSYGDTFSVKIGLKRRLLLSRDKDLTKYILKGNHKNYYKSKIQTRYLSKYLGNGLLTANGDFWLKQRRLIQPAFQKEKMQRLIGLMEKTIVSELKEIPLEKPIPVFEVMNQLAFKVVGTSLFHMSASEELLKRLQFIIQEVQEFLVKEIRLPHKGWWFKLTGEIKKHKDLSEERREIIKSIIQERKESNETHDDLLDMLLETSYEDTGKAMSTKQLIDEISILFVAGHETTANALSFTTFLLAKHPEICDKILKEIDQVESEITIVAEQLSRLQYTRACIDESMRLYPPAWITDRENLEDDTIGDFHLRKDTLIGVSFYELHRNPKYWERPNEFDPERFLGERKKDTAGIYYPFGAGPRMCIGMGFAIYEMVLAISYLVKNYTLSTTQEEIELNPLITLKPIGIAVKFEKR